MICRYYLCTVHSYFHSRKVRQFICSQWQQLALMKHWRRRSMHYYRRYKLLLQIQAFIYRLHQRNFRMRFYYFPKDRILLLKYAIFKHFNMFMQLQYCSLFSFFFCCAGNSVLRGCICRCSSFWRR